MIVKRPNLEVATKRLLSPSAGKNAGIVLVSCRAWKCVSTVISGGMHIPRSQVVICCDR